MEIKSLKKLILTIMLILLMSGIATAEQTKDWPHEQRNIAPEGIEYVLYDFEEGSNCGTFKNQFPNVTTILLSCTTLFSYTVTLLYH